MKKRSVEVVESFCGWDFLGDLIKKCEWSRDRELVAALFETGGRVSEVLQLDTRMFDVQEPYLVVKSMPVFKRYEKVAEVIKENGARGWLTRKKKDYRTYPIPLKEPLCPLLLKRAKDVDGRLFNISRHQVWRIVTKLDERVFPHWFRAQRASQLALEYGFDIHDLIDWFNWKSLATAVHYSRMGWKGLASKMVR